MLLNTSPSLMLKLCVTAGGLDGRATVVLIWGHVGWL